MSKLIRWNQPAVTNVVKSGDFITFGRRGGATKVPPEVISVIPDMDLTQNVLMTPYDTSVHFKYADTYAVTSINDGLVFDTATGILSGTPTALDNHNPIVTATNSFGSVASLSFNIAVTA